MGQRRAMLRPGPKPPAEVPRRRVHRRGSQPNRGFARSSESRTADSSFLPSHDPGYPGLCAREHGLLNEDPGVPVAASLSESVALLALGALVVQFLLHLLTDVGFI